MNEQLLKKMKQRKGKLKSALDLDKKTLDDFVARKDSLNKKEYKEAYDLQCSYNKLAHEYNEVCDDIVAYEKASEEKRKELESGLLAKYSDKKIEEINDFEKTNEGKINPTLKGVLIGGVCVLALVAAINYFAKNNKNVSATSDVAIVDVQEELEPGSYGTFLDVNDNEQVEARANYIYNKHFKSKLEEIKKLNPKEEYTKEITPENIANIIRVYNDEAPIVDGVKVYGEDYINYYFNLAGKMYGNLPSDKHFNEIGFMPMSYLFKDGSQSQYLAEVFDKNFEDIAKARNNGTYDESVEAIKAYATNLRDRLLLLGMSGEITPMSVQKGGLGTFDVAMGRFAEYVLEWDLSNQKVTCIPVCTDYKTGEKQLWFVEKIYEQIETGEYNQIIAKMTGSGNVEPPMGAVLFEQSDRLIYESATGSTFAFN